MHLVPADANPLYYGRNRDGVTLQLFRQYRSRQFALWLAVTAVLLRTLLPEGFMPERLAGERGIALAICYASPLAKLRADRGLPEKTHAHGDCVFSAAAGPALPSSGFDFGLNAGVTAETSAHLPLVLLSSFSNGRPPARAPPAFS